MQSFDPERLAELAERNADSFRSAAPFPHVVIDDFMRPEAAEKVLSEFEIPDDEAVYYHHYNNRSRGFYDVPRMGPAVQQLFADLADPRFLAFLSKLSGIDDLLYDSALDGGGLHDVHAGGYLNMHVDFLVHTTRPTWRRRLNLLIYLNKDWKEEYGGALEFWDLPGRKQYRKIRPDFNRCALFETTRSSFHGFPEPLRCLEGQSRKLVAVYYYTDEKTPCPITSTNYRPLPGDSLWKRFCIAADRLALRAFSLLKRRGLFSDRLYSRLSKRL